VLTAAQARGHRQGMGRDLMKVAERSPGAELDEKTFREALMRTPNHPKAKKPGKKK